MKLLGQAANALQGMAQQRGQISQRSVPVAAVALESSFVSAWKDPGFVGYARGIGARCDIVPAHFDDALLLPNVLREDVAKYTAFFLHEILTRSP